MKYLDRRHPNNLELFNALFNNDITAIKRITENIIFDPITVEFIKNDIRFDCTEEDFNDTPLHYAARRNRVEIIEILLRTCYKMNESKNRNLEYPAHVALKMKHVIPFKLLCKNFIATERNKRGENMLHLAVIHEVEEVIEFLCQKVHHNTRTNKGNSPLILAAMSGNENIVKILLKEEANLTSINSYGDTALHAAVRCDKENICKLLIKHGSDLNVVNGRNDTPLHIAISRKNVGIVKLLQKYGASKDIRNNDGQTPIECALKLFEESKDPNMDIILKSMKTKKINDILYFLKKFSGKSPNLVESVALRRCKTQLGTKFVNPREKYLSDKHSQEDNQSNPSAHSK